MPRIPEQKVNLKDMREDKVNKVFDHETGQFIDVAKAGHLVEGVVKIAGDKCIKGYFTPVLSKNITATFGFGALQGNGSMICINKSIVEGTNKTIYYDARQGTYRIDNADIPARAVKDAESVLGYGIFPYNFKRDYAAESNLELFQGQEVLDEGNLMHKYAHLLKYTFGLEFETAAGYIPQEECFRNGLIPLRDGSIDGIEYATIVMDHKNGPALIQQQVESLKNRTCVNKECSLHMHLGGFPVTGNAIVRLWNLLYDLQEELNSSFLPRDAFNTDNWKRSGKSYCKKLESKYASIEALYKWASMGESYYGSLTQPHPADNDKHAKWNIKTRYYWVNMIGMLFYKTVKTVEFRILAPTFSFNKIMGWLYIFNAIMQYAENNKEAKNIGLRNIMFAVYPKDFALIMSHFLDDCELLKEAQESLRDFCGKTFLLDDVAFEGDYDF